MPIEDDLLWYLVWRVVRQEDAVLTKTKLVKLVYLVDLEMARRTRRQATQLRWRYYHYGPYAIELERVIDRQTGTTISQRGGRAADRDFVQFFPIGTPRPSLITGRLQSIADDVCRQWGIEDLNALLNFVYFETAPMRNARRGEYLDLAVQADEPIRHPYVPLDAPAVDPELVRRVSEWRTNFEEEFPARRLEPSGPPDMVEDEEESDLSGLRGTLGVDPKLRDDST